MRRNVGSLYRRGKIWWLQVYQAGEAMRKSTGTSEKAEARRLQREREGQIAKGEAIPKPVKATWDETSTDLRGYYQAYGTRNLREAGHRLAHLDRHFQGIKLADIDAAAITGYVVKRKGMQGKLLASVGRTLSPRGSELVSEQAVKGC
jgi:hypothetical protein